MEKFIFAISITTKHNTMNTKNNLIINWELDTFIVIRAKRQLAEFLKEQKEFKIKGISTPKIDSYHNRRILELNAIINN